MRITCGVFIGVHPRSLVQPLDSPWKDYEMRKGFTRKPQSDEPATPGKNYITRSGLQRLKDEHRFLLTRERPAVTEVVAWAACDEPRCQIICPRPCAHTRAGHRTH